MAKKINSRQIDIKYSTDEQIIGTWIDGQPVYRRTFTGTISALVNTRDFTTLLSGVTNIINSYGEFDRGDGLRAQIGHTLGSNGTSSTPLQQVSMVYLEANIAKMMTFSSQARSSRMYHVTLEYTR